VFDGLDAGQYTGEFSKAGYVDPGGNQVVRPANGWNVTTGSTSVSTYQYDRAGTASFTFDTKYLTNPAWNLPSVPLGTAVTLVHQSLPSPGYRAEDVAQNSSGYNFLALFPFTTSYAAVAGKCVTSAPAWTTPTSLSVNPASVGTPNPLKLRMPAIGVHVTRNGSNRSNARVKIRSTSTTCSINRALTPNTNASGDTIPTSTTASTYAFPPGPYIVCADDNNGTSTRKRELPWDNTAEAGPLFNIDIQTASSTGGNSAGACP
jgi:hypothetical protein